MIRKEKYNLRLVDPKLFVGAIVQKTNAVCTCLRVEDYIRKDGEPSFVLIWECEWKADGTKILATTSANSFNAGSLPNTKTRFFPKEKKNEPVRETQI